MGDERKSVSKKAIIIVAVIASILIYAIGVFSGLYANKLIKQRVETDINFLRSYTDVSTLDLKNMLLLQFFNDNLDDCKFSEISVSQLHEQLYPYWQRLPKRLEAYEMDGVVTEEYITLKREYIRLSLRIWLIALNNYRECDTTNFIPLLYFYSQDCETCVRQGQILDAFNKEGLYADKNVVVFPIDGYFEDDTVYLLRQYYNITQFPAIIVNDNVLQKEVVTVKDILDEI
jgi:thiol-disulfide isomerase/thioredoxin|tara:strand:+ start:174 stop:866 length:693 start_codon:yes stop_codon:yes gene_type:complete